MTVDPTPSVRPGRPAPHAIRAMATVAAITIAACSSGTTDESTAASTREPTGSVTAPPLTATTVDATTITSGTADANTAASNFESRAAGSGRATGSFGDIPVTFTLPDGWDNIGWGVTKGGTTAGDVADPIFGLFFVEVGNTYTDSCPSVQLDPPVGPTVDDLASVWGDLPAFDATVPTDITVDGFHGKLVEFTVPDYDEDDCAYGQFMLLGGVGDPTDGYWAQGPNHHHQLRILDVDGTRVVIGAGWYPDTSAQDRADIDEMLNSIQIG
jgi:hypothetical protein